MSENERRNPYPLLKENEKEVLIFISVIVVYATFLVIFLNYCKLCAMILGLLTIIGVFGFAIYVIAETIMRRYRRRIEWELANNV